MAVCRGQRDKMWRWETHKPPCEAATSAGTTDLRVNFRIKDKQQSVDYVDVSEEHRRVLDTAVFLTWHHGWCSGRGIVLFALGCVSLEGFLLRM